MEGAATLPSIIYAEKFPQDRIIQRIIVEREKGLVPQALKKVLATTVIDECRQIARGFCQKASHSLSQLPDCDARKSLKALVEFVIERNK
jgi:geranylgeranyl pyrophosphate synthase